MRLNLLKVFLTLSISFGICVGILFYFASEPINNLQAAIFAGLVGGLFFGGVMTIFAWSRGQTTDINISQEIDLDVPYEEAFKKCINALSSLSVNINVEDKESGFIKARGPMTWSSWGQVMEINLRRTDDGKTWAKVSSKPWLPLQIADRGENQNNVKQIIEFLEK